MVDWNVIFDLIKKSVWPTFDPTRPMEYEWKNGSVYSYTPLTDGSSVKNWIADAETFCEAQRIISAVTELPRP